jgi:uncharacterized protein
MSDVEAVGALLESDRWIERVRAQREHLAEEIELHSIESDLRAIADELRQVESARREARDDFNAASDQASTFRNRRDDVERRLTEATGPGRELAALQTELERLRIKTSDAEDDEVARLLTLEPLDELVDTLRQRAQPLVDRRQDLLGAIKELHASLEEELVTLRATRAERAAALSTELFKRYESALARAGVSGAACIDGTRCDGCRVALSDLDLARAKKMLGGQISSCPHCGRLLIPC